VLPLGEGGRIVCHTCHDPHDVKAHRKGLRLDYQPLCDQCHAGHVKQAQPAPASSPPVKSTPAPVQPGKPAAGRPATPAR
jgi:predicted CXXCH cytochrome family protein